MDERVELAKAYFGIVLAFAILLNGSGMSLIQGFVIAGVTVGVGLLAHELAHRSVAHKFKKRAFFVANDGMILLAIGLSFLGVIFAAPGAVVIHGAVTRKQHGLIALSGPMANVVVALLFLALFPIYPLVSSYGLMINALLAIFNLLPIPGFDGFKVLDWSRPAYFAAVAIAVVINIVNLLVPKGVVF